MMDEMDAAHNLTATTLHSSNQTMLCIFAQFRRVLFGLRG
jgi:hypothetical protein